MSNTPLQGGYPPYGGLPAVQYPNQGYPPHGASYGQQNFPSQQQTGYPYPTQQQVYGASPVGQYGAPQQPYVQPTPPSPGYGPPQNPATVPRDDAMIKATADALRKAMKGFGTDEAALIRNLSHFPGPLINDLKMTYQKRHNRSLESDIGKETSHNFRYGLICILEGPLQRDVTTLKKALKGLGTDETRLNDVLIARSNADLQAIKHLYETTYHTPLTADVGDDLSGKTARIFSMILSATRNEESSPCIPQAIDSDVVALQQATEARLGTDELTVCSILTSRSDGQIRAIAAAYEARFRLPLETVLVREFSGHMKQVLVQILRAAIDPAMRDAMLLEDCMAGMGTRDELLIDRVVRFHWDAGRMSQIKGAYKVKYGKDLANRVKGETGGDYQKLLLAMIE